MVKGLLFLIFLAIVCPRALRFLFALMVIGAIMAFGEGHAAPSNKPDFMSIWGSVNKVCHSSDDDADRACNQIVILEEMMTDNGCKFRHKIWICPQTN